VVAIEDADHRVDPGGPLQHLRPVPLNEAARDDHALDLPGFLGAYRLADHPQRFLLGRLKKPTGIHHDRVGAAKS
jgi:hypothetical protein